MKRTAWLLLLLLPLTSAADEPASPPAADVEPAAKVPKLPPIAPPSAEQLNAAIDRGIAFLLANQNKNGSWGSATLTKDLTIYAPEPGAHHAFRAAGTSMCISALIESGGGRPDVLVSLERGENWLFDHLYQVRRATPDAIYNVWAHCYAIQALVRMDRRLPDDASRRLRIKTLIEQQFDLLDRYESVDGGWGYYDFRYQTKKPSSDSISFVNAAVLVAFREAKDAGFEPPQKLVDRAIAATLRQRLPDHSYLYGEYLKWQPRRGINRPAGSLGRTPSCNAALRMWDQKQITDEVTAAGLDRLFARAGWLDIGRKRPIPHESWFQVAGYFYYFGHYYAAYGIGQLPAEKRSEYQSHLAHTLLDRQEKDGSWWDFPLYAYHQPYGTAFALMTLVRCR